MDDGRAHYLESVGDGRLAALLRRWKAAHPSMGALALVPEAEQGEVGRLLEVARAEEVPIVGAVFPALIVDARQVATGVGLLRFDAMPRAVLLREVPSAAAALPAVADAIVDAIRPGLEALDAATLMLLCDGMIPCVGSLLDELYLRLGNRVRWVGANAGSETFRPLPCLFDGGGLAPRGALAILLPGDLGATVEHGYPVPARMTTATSTDGNRILQIDWRPAFEVYQALGREEFGVEIDRENFYRNAVHFPFGIVRANGVIVVRIPVALEADGSLLCVGEVPANAMLTLLDAPKVDSARTVEALVRGLAEAGVPPAGRDLLLFYCAGRRLHLGPEGYAAELGAFARASGARRILGALSLGEIGEAGGGGYPLFHNAALVASAWGAG